MSKQEKLFVKVCGLTREKDAELCQDLGVDYMGFIFVPGSPRYISPVKAAAMPSGKALRVGVFAWQKIEDISSIMKSANLDFAQLHGAESAEFCHRLGAERVIRTFWPQRILKNFFEERQASVAEQAGAEIDSSGFAELLHAACEPFADACSLFLMDSGLGGGGSGLAQDWSLLKNFSPSRPWLLAGGIGPDNAGLVRETCRPSGLDCNSGVESAPGLKNESKLRQLMMNLYTNTISEHEHEKRVF